MSRLPRYVLPGVPMHVVQRGHNRQDIFLSTEDHKHYVSWLEEAATTHGLAIHAYVLMTNHIHLLATPATEAALPLTMKAVNQRYTPYLNRRLGRSGTLWEGRYRATVIDSERYLLSVSRYIEMNPVRAGIVSHPASYRWSSFRANALGQLDALETPHETYDALGAEEGGRQTAYRALFEEVMEADTLALIREATHKGWVLGGDDFAASIAKQSGRRARPMPRGRPKKGSDPI